MQPATVKVDYLKFTITNPIALQIAINKRKNTFILQSNSREI